jgi:hypothetical protein
MNAREVSLSIAPSRHVVCVWRWCRGLQIGSFIPTGYKRQCDGKILADSYIDSALPLPRYCPTCQRLISIRSEGCS